MFLARFQNPKKKCLKSFVFILFYLSTPSTAAEEAAMGKELHLARICRTDCHLSLRSGRVWWFNEPKIASHTFHSRSFRSLYIWFNDTQIENPLGCNQFIHSCSALLWQAFAEPS